MNNDEFQVRLATESATECVFIYPNEHAHLWADVPLLLAVSTILWVWHPNRMAPETSRA